MRQKFRQQSNTRLSHAHEIGRPPARRGAGGVLEFKALEAMELSVRDLLDMNEGSPVTFDR